MEPDDLLCSRNARPQKDGKGVARCPSKGGVTSKFGVSIMWPFDVCMASIDHANLEKIEHPRFLTNRSFRDRNIEVLYFYVVK